MSDPTFTICETEAFLDGCTGAFEDNFDTSNCDMQMELAATAPLRQRFKGTQTVQCYGCEQSVDAMIWR